MGVLRTTPSVFSSRFSVKKTKLINRVTDTDDISIGVDGYRGGKSLIHFPGCFGSSLAALTIHRVSPLQPAVMLGFALSLQQFKLRQAFRMR